jgi:hypothetical protein
MLPPIALPRVQSGPQAQLGADQTDLQRLQDNGAGWRQVKNPVLRTLAGIGDVAGTILAPGVAAAVPGTTLHNRVLQNWQGQRVAGDQAVLQGLTQQQLDQANLAHTQAETAAIPINAGQKRQTYLAALAGKGLKEDESGNIVPDETSPVYQQEQQKSELLDAQTEAAKSNIELRNATAALKRAQADPNSPAFKLAQQRVTVAQQNANAAGERAKAYWGRYLQSAYNVGLDNQVLPGAPQISDEGGNQTVVGTGNASQATKAQANVAQFNDVKGATDNIEQVASRLVAKGGKLNDAKVAAAIADPNSTATQWAQGQFVNSGLTPEQRDYVTTVKAYKENLQALRKSAGGSVSDAQVDRLMQMAPGASTPDLDYLKRQTAQIRQMWGRLAPGATTAAGGLSVQGRPNAMKPPTQPGPVQLQPGEVPHVNPVTGQKIVIRNNKWVDVTNGKEVK